MDRAKTGSGSEEGMLSRLCGNGAGTEGMRVRIEEEGEGEQVLSVAL